MKCFILPMHWSLLWIASLNYPWSGLSRPVFSIYSTVFSIILLSPSSMLDLIPCAPTLLLSSSPSSSYSSQFSINTVPKISKKCHVFAHHCNTFSMNGKFIPTFSNCDRAQTSFQTSLLRGVQSLFPMQREHPPPVNISWSCHLENKYDLANKFLKLNLGDQILAIHDFALISYFSQRAS